MIQAYYAVRVKSLQRMIERGTYAEKTYDRMVVWNNIIWPLILELGKPNFTLDEYRIRQYQYSRHHNMGVSNSKLSGGLKSLTSKHVLRRELSKRNSKLSYSIHYRLIPYMRKRINLEYGLAVKEVSHFKQ
jgi:hypothetical protein